MIAAAKVSSRGKLAKALGVSLTTIQTYVLLGMPCDGEDGYDVEDCRQWQAAYRASRRGAGGAEGDCDSALRTKRLRAEIRKLQQEARAKKLKNDEAEGLLLPADD